MPTLISPLSFSLLITSVFMTFSGRSTAFPAPSKAGPIRVLGTPPPYRGFTRGPIPLLFWPLPASWLDTDEALVELAPMPGICGDTPLGRSGGYTTPRPSVSPCNTPVKILLSFQTTAFHCTIGQWSGGRGYTTPFNVGGRAHCSPESAWREGECSSATARFHIGASLRPFRA